MDFKLHCLHDKSTCQCISVLIWLVKTWRMDFPKMWRDWLTNDDDQDSSHYLQSQGEGDERQDSDVVPVEERGIVMYRLFGNWWCKYNHSGVTWCNRSVFLHSVPVSSSLFDDSLHVCDVSQEQSDVQHALRHRLLRGIQVHVQIRGWTSLKKEGQMSPPLVKHVFFLSRSYILNVWVSRCLLHAWLESVGGFFSFSVRILKRRARKRDLWHQGKSFEVIKYPEGEG